VPGRYSIGHSCIGLHVVRDLHRPTAIIANVKVVKVEVKYMA